MAALQPANDALVPEACDSPESAADLLAIAGDGLLEALYGQSAPTYIATTGGMLLYANRAYRQIADREGVGRALTLAHRRMVERVAERGDALVQREQIAANDGIKTYNARHFPLFSRDHRVIAVGGSFADATGETEALALAQHEKQRFQDILRATSDWIWEINETGSLSFVSDRIVNVLGLPPALLYGRGLAAIGRFVGNEHGPSDAPLAIAARRPFRDAAFEINDSAGALRRFHLSGVPVFNSAGRFKGFRGTATDITARFAAEEVAQQSRHDLECALQELTVKNLQLDVALRKATAATQAKSEFLATMSHELRTPLNAIIGFSEMMHLRTFGELKAPYDGYATDILGASRHLLELIDDILDIARIEGDSLRMDIRPVALSDIVNEARTMIIARASDKHMDIATVHYSGDAVIRVDQTRALQVLLNVLGNAIKFTPVGGVIGLEVAAADNNTIAVTVWDSGPGVAADKRELIFERFQQVHESILARSQEGIGLGLTLSRHLARLMGGDLALTHSDSHGSRFQINFPLIVQA